MKTTFLPAFSRAVSLFLGLVLPVYLSAQFSDDFSDGDFLQNPPWTGTLSKFSVQGGVLQLRDTAPSASNTAYLSVYAPTSLNDSTQWTFFFQLQFAPSASNYGRFYLAASQTDLSAPLQGYFLKLGGASGDADALELYRQDGTNTVLLCSSPLGTLAAEPAQARVRVNRTPNGQWSLWADYSGGNNWIFQAEASDTTYSLLNYAGLYCRYTSSRSEAFLWDEVGVSPLYQDVTPPAIQQVLLPTQTKIGLQFSEPVDTMAAKQASNYWLQPGITQVLAAYTDSTNQALVWLDLSSPLSNGEEYRITVDSISDWHSNWSLGLTFSFVFYFIETAQPGDVVMTEIMADPSPPQVLPNAEYVELYNRSNRVIQLAGWVFSAGNSSAQLPAGLFMPGDYVVLCDKTSVSLFQNNLSIVGVDDFPALTNDGTTLQLMDQLGHFQAMLTYSASWYADAEKEDGGWSLELIGANGPLDCAGNWHASLDLSGGTPGRANSLPAEAADIQAPVLLSAVAESATAIVLRFDEEIDTEEAFPEAFTASPVINVVEMLPDDSDKTTLRLLLDAPLQQRQLYRLTLAANLSDCMGNTLGQNIMVDIGLAETPVTGDLIINELLFNPQSGGKDFVEMVNRSEKIINIKGLRVLNTLNNQAETIEKDHLVLPGAYVVITADKNDLQDRYVVLSPPSIVEQELPGFDDDMGIVVVKSGLMTLDSFGYEDDYHAALISGSADGISLERLRIAGDTNDPANWHSAAGTVGFATPTAPNSQAITTVPGDGVLSLYNSVFSPDDDGHDDVLLMRITPGTAGAVLNLVVFDARGRLIRHLARNELPGNESDYQWDGVTEDGVLAGLGIYVLWAELFTPQGQVRRYIKSCVLAKSLK